MKKYRWTLLSVAVMMLALLLGACGGAGQGADGTGGTGAAPTEAVETGEGIETGLPGGEEPASEEGGVETGLPGGEESGAAEGVGSGLTVAQIMENPQAYVDQTITISGNAEEMLGTRAFKLDEDDALAGGVDNDLLVIGATETEPMFDNAWLNSPVTVSGTIRMFDQTQLEQEIGYTLDPDLLTAWNGKPVLVAQSVTAEQSQ